MTKYLKTKPGSIEEIAAKMASQVSESEYQQQFKKELEKAGKNIGAMTPAEKKAFFNKIDSKYKAKDEEVKESVNEKKNYKRDSNFFVNDKTDTLKKMSGRQGYNKSTLTDYLAQKSDKKEDDVYFDDTDLVYKDKTVLKNAETKTVDQMLKALQKEAVDNPYAVGMAQAMKSTGDKPPLKKATITKAHDIAKSIEKDQKEEVKESDAYDNNRYMMKKYGGQILARPDNSNTKDGKDHVYAPNAKIAKQLYSQGKKVYKEEDYTKNEDKDIDELTAAQKKLPPALQKAIKDKEDKKEEVEEMKEARWEIEGRVSYKGVGPEDGFHMVIDAPTESAAEDKAYDELEKARRQRKIGPGGGGGIDDMEIEYIEKTNDRLQPVTQQPLGNSYDPTQKEEKNPDVVSDNEKKEKKTKGKADTGSPKTPVDTEPQVDYRN